MVGVSCLSENRHTIKFIVHTLVYDWLKMSMAIDVIVLISSWLTNAGNVVPTDIIDWSRSLF